MCKNVMKLSDHFTMSICLYVHFHFSFVTFNNDIVHKKEHARYHSDGDTNNPACIRHCAAKRCHCIPFFNICTYPE